MLDRLNLSKISSLYPIYTKYLTSLRHLQLTTNVANTINTTARVLLHQRLCCIVYYEFDYKKPS